MWLTKDEIKNEVSVTESGYFIGRIELAEMALAAVFAACVPYLPNNAVSLSPDLIERARVWIWALCFAVVFQAFDAYKRHTLRSGFMWHVARLGVVFVIWVVLTVAVGYFNDVLKAKTLFALQMQELSLIALYAVFVATSFRFSVKLTVDSFLVHKSK